jgi:hypothetical protein
MKTLSVLVIAFALCGSASATSLKKPIKTINGKSAQSLFKILKENGAEYKNFIESSFVRLGDITCQRSHPPVPPSCTAKWPKEVVFTGAQASRLIKELDKAGIDEGVDGDYDSSAVICSAGLNMGALKAFQACEIYD